MYAYIADILNFWLTFLNPTLFFHENSHIHRLYVSVNAWSWVIPNPNKPLENPLIYYSSDKFTVDNFLLIIQSICLLFYVYIWSWWWKHFCNVFSWDCLRESWPAWFEITQCQIIVPLKKPCRQQVSLTTPWLVRKVMPKPWCTLGRKVMLCPKSFHFRRFAWMSLQTTLMVSWKNVCQYFINLAASI